MTFKNIVLPFVVASIVSACSNAETHLPSTTEVIEISISDIPQSVSAIVSSVRPDFKATEVLKKVRDGRVYYDVEGELPSGDEIEFDFLMTSSGPEIVEIQRDMSWDGVPLMAKDEAAKGNTEGLKVSRVIESIQTDDSIIYEIFVEGHAYDPRFEVRVKDDVAKLLPARWKH